MVINGDFMVINGDFMVIDSDFMVIDGDFMVIFFLGLFICCYFFGEVYEVATLSFTDLVLIFSQSCSGKLRRYLLNNFL